METPPNTRIPSLDGLRAVSISLVIFSHFLGSSGFSFYNDVGNLGVRIFFIISGFLITGLLLEEFDQTRSINLTKFYFRRTLRIFPPYYFYLFVMLLLTLSGRLEIPSASFLPALTYTSNYLNPGTQYLSHSWSLSVEEQFYLVYPVVMLLLGRRGTVRFLVSVMVVSPLIRVVDYRFFYDPGAFWLVRGFHSNADALAAGCLLAFLRNYLHQNGSYRKMLNSNLPLIALPLIFFLNGLNDYPLFKSGVSFTVCNLLIAVCLDWAIVNYKNNLAGKILNSTPVVTLGIMSYSIYLWQQPFLNPNSQTWFLKFPFNLLGIAICSGLSYHLIEKFSLRLRRKLSRKSPGELHGNS